MRSSDARKSDASLQHGGRFSSLPQLLGLRGIERRTIERSGESTPPPATPEGKAPAGVFHPVLGLLCATGIGLDNIQSRCGPRWGSLPSATGAPAVSCGAYRSSTKRVRAPSASLRATASLRQGAG